MTDLAIAGIQVAEFNAAAAARQLHNSKTGLATDEGR
jgi:hypothetical protein